MIKANTQCINSISRPILNQRLVESLPSDITTRFNVKLSRIDFKSRKAYALSLPPSKSVPGQEESQTQGTGGDLEKTGHGSKGKAKSSWTEDEGGTGFDLVIGCDGSWSKVRSEMMRVERYAICNPARSSLNSQDRLLTILHPRCLYRTAHACRCE
jgi:kynurenine 3-monooxygenase